MNYKTITISFLSVLLLSGNAFAEIQVLDLQTASNSVSGNCGEFALESVSLETSPSNASAGGSVNVINSQGQPLAAKQVASGQVAKLSVQIKQLGEESVKGLDIRIITVDDEGEVSVVETVEASESGQAVFERGLAGGSYQVALSCNAAAAGFATTSSGVGVAALALGGTAIAVGASSSSSSSSNIEAAEVQPRVDPPALQSQSASPSGDFNAF